MSAKYTAADGARFFAFAAAVSIFFSITAKEFLLGAAILLLLVSRQRWRMPRPVVVPLALFIAGTAVSIAFSVDPASSLPQVKKFYAFLILPVLYTTLRDAADSRLVLALCAGAGVLSSLLSFVQFARSYLTARTEGLEFYSTYVIRRTTGFMSHWMTFGGEAMIAVAILAAFLFAVPLDRKWRAITWTGACIVLAAIVLNMTRSVWIATVLALIYLLWQWRPKLLLVAPLIALAALAIPPVRQRASSLLEPRGETDSNQHRIVTWRTGIEMIKDHPWVGLGPEQVGKQFRRYVPPDIKRLPDGWYGHLHNNFLQYAAERGLPTLAALLWLLLRMLWDFVLGIRNKVENAWILHVAVASWIAVMANGFFELNLGNSEVLHLFLAVMACAYCVLDARQSKNAATQG